MPLPPRSGARRAPRRPGSARPPAPPSAAPAVVAPAGPLARPGRGRTERQRERSRADERRPPRLLEIVSERTGYPTDMLDLDADLEADLGIDSIKRVEIAGTHDRVAAAAPTLPTSIPSR